MNKSLEVIEAAVLFGLSGEAIEVVIHPQSRVHALVQCVDGSLLLHAGHPDMRSPIACALSWPERLPTEVASLDPLLLAGLGFEAVDMQRFGLLKLAYQVLAAGLGARVAFNAANEVAVAGFLAGELGFSDIETVVIATTESRAHPPLTELDAVLAYDLEMRLEARSRARSC